MNTGRRFHLNRSAGRPVIGVFRHKLKLGEFLQRIENLKKKTYGNTRAENYHDWN